MPEIETFKSSRIELREGKAVVFIAVKAVAMRVDPEILSAVSVLFGAPGPMILKYIEKVEEAGEIVTPVARTKKDGIYSCGECGSLEGEVHTGACLVARIVRRGA